MTEHKYTDEEVIKALECCINSTHYGDCIKNKCPLIGEEGCMVWLENLYPHALDLIKRQNAEIERLKNGWRADVILTEQAKAEAIKEFAGKLKGELTAMQTMSDGKLVFGVSVERIESVVKEMLEGG